MNVAAHLKGRPRRLTALTVGLACLAVPAAAILAGCGSSSSASSQSQTPQTRQIMVAVASGNITKTVSGTLKITSSGSKPTAKVTITGDGATEVAAGEAVTAMTGTFPGARSGTNGASSGTQPSGVPSPGAGQGSGASPGSGQQGNVPQNGEGTMPSPGAGQGYGQSGGVAGGGTAQQGGGLQSGGLGARRGGTKGIVVSTSTAANGSVTAVVRLQKMPSGAKVGSSGFATITIDVVAKNVLVVPTRAITTKNGTSTVQVLVNGNPKTVTITTGKSGNGMTEVVSGLQKGDNIVYELSFPGFQNGAGASSGYGGYGNGGYGNGGATQGAAQ